LGDLNLKRESLRKKGTLTKKHDCSHLRLDLDGQKMGNSAKKRRLGVVLIGKRKGKTFKSGGQKRPRYVQYFRPRKARSEWQEKNRERGRKSSEMGERLKRNVK